MYVKRNIKTAFAKPLLKWKSNKYHIFLCVSERVCVPACMNALCVYVCVCVCACQGMCLRACSLTYPALNLSSAVCVALPNVPILFHKRHDFREKLLNIKCVF
jgi:hypothetical protein